MLPILFIELCILNQKNYSALTLSLILTIAPTTTLSLKPNPCTAYFINDVSLQNTPKHVWCVKYHSMYNAAKTLKECTKHLGTKNIANYHFNLLSIIINTGSHYYGGQIAAFKRRNRVETVWCIYSINDNKY